MHWPLPKWPSSQPPKCYYLPCRAIAQGCSEYNITILVDQRDAKRALRTVHGRFYLASLPIAIGIVGMSGQIGTTFMQQLRDRAEVTCLAVLALGCGLDTTDLAPLVLPQGACWVTPAPFILSDGVVSLPTPCCHMMLRL